MTVIEKLDMNVKQANSDFQAIKSKIVEKGVSVADGTRTAEYASKVDEVYEAGKKAEYDAFWYDFMSVQSYSVGVGSFCGRGWNKKTFRPNVDLVMKGNANYSFYNNGYEGDLVELCSNRGITTDFKPTSLNAAFRYVFFTRLPVIDLTNCTSIELTFADCRYLVTIDKLIFSDVTKTLSSSFYNCVNLENLTIDGTICHKVFNVQWCTKLTHDSLMSIINALKDYSGTDTWMPITLGSENIAKLTEEELAIMTNKQWEFG